MRVTLSVDLPQFDTHDRHLLPHLGIEEVGRGIEGAEQLALVFFQDGFQLEDVAHQQHLLAAEGLRIAGKSTKHLVDEVDDVGTYHRNLVDDNQLYFSQQFPLCPGVFQRFFDMAAVIALIIRQQWIKWQTEEAVKRRATGIDGSNAGRGKNHMFLLSVLRHIPQEGALTRARLTCQEKRATRVIDYL